MVRTPGAVEGGRMMARYIDADALLDRIPNPYERRAVARWVDEQPTAPVREVVLCQDCLYGHRYFDVRNGETDSWVECRNPDGLHRDVSTEEYCSASIRRKEDG